MHPTGNSSPQKFLTGEDEGEPEYAREREKGMEKEATTRWVDLLPCKPPLISTRIYGRRAKIGVRLWLAGSVFSRNAEVCDASGTLSSWMHVTKLFDHTQSTFSYFRKELPRVIYFDSAVFTQLGRKTWKKQDQFCFTKRIKAPILGQIRNLSIKEVKNNLGKFHTRACDFLPRVLISAAIFVCNKISLNCTIREKYLRIISLWNIFVYYKNRGEITRDRGSGLQSTPIEIFHSLIVYFGILSDFLIITHMNDKSNWKCTMLWTMFIHANFFHCVLFHWLFHAVTHTTHTNRTVIHIEL